MCSAAHVLGRTCVRPHMQTPDSRNATSNSIFLCSPPSLLHPLSNRPHQIYKEGKCVETIQGFSAAKLKTAISKACA
jgi:hypothetical protein